MPTPALVNQADVEGRYPPQFVRQVFSDNGALVVGPRFGIAASVGSRQAEAVLNKAWPTAKIPTLVAEDEAIKSLVCALVMYEGMQGKPQWCGPGAPYERLRTDSLKVLELLAVGQLRTSAEAVAGANPNRRGNITSPDSPTRMFANTRDRPRRGGY